MPNILEGSMLITISAALLFASASCGADSHDGLLGSWRIDPAQSSYTGRAPLRSGTVRFERVQSGVHIVCDVITASGATFHFEYQGPKDGTINVVTGNPYYDGESTVWTDEHTARRTELRAGTVIGTTTLVLSSDGQSFTAISERSAPEDGHLYASTILWRRNKP